MQSERLKKFMPIIFYHEGGFVNNPADPGGATKYGISLRFLKGLSLEVADLDHDGNIDIDDIKLITHEIATPIYEQRFYTPMQIEQFRSDELALQLFDMGVNAGPRQAIKLLQQELSITADGIVGAETLRVANSFSFNTMAIRYKYGRIFFYKNLVKIHPEYSIFLKGWINRVNECTV
jgi:lysozyme family protein